jgi:hypothetical protein
MNGDEPMSAEEQERYERFTSHRARFQERRNWAGFCRWMAGRFGQPSTADKPDKPPVWLRERAPVYRGRRSRRAKGP